MALGSAEECKLWSRYAADIDYIEAVDADKWQSGYGEIARMLQGLRCHLSTTPTTDD